MGSLGLGRLRLSLLASASLIALLVACNYPQKLSGDPIPTAVALTLTARQSQPTIIAEISDNLPTPIPTLDLGILVKPTVTLNPNIEPAGKIVYTCQYSERTGFNQICIINADGSNPRTLSPPSEGDDVFPSLSPDSKSVLFASDRSGRYQIYELDLETDEIVQLTDFTNLHAYAPAVSPDNSFIGFYTRVSAEDYPKSHSLWIMNRDGSDAHAITDSLGGAWDPAWAPDSLHILFTSEVDGDPQLFIIAADGGNPRQITDLDGIRGRNDWSSDGITLATYIGESWDRDIYLFDLVGANLRQITDGGNNLAPSFSPDGQWITFTSYRDNYREDLGCEIYIMRIDGTDTRRLTENDICDWQPRWGK